MAICYQNDKCENEVNHKKARPKPGYARPFGLESTIVEISSL